LAIEEAILRLLGLTSRPIALASINFLNYKLTMKTLIITVGTRQIGWRCQDNIIRCFGTDGFRGEPKHTDELYKEIGLKRESHENESFPWSVRDLAERYYSHCKVNLNQDFSAVELLIDQEIINEQVKQGLNHVMLWATNQPDSVSWQYRRLDTLWLARLMQEKIHQDFPTIKVDVFEPSFDISKTESIREELQGYILEYLQEKVLNSEDNEFNLLIENKGASPSIAENLVIYAAGLVRQYPVYILTPQEPEPFYETKENEVMSCKFSEVYKTISMEKYFWPLEKLRIISAWKRGDFSEAKIWLESHRENYEILYKLAQWLVLATNREKEQFINNIGNWITSNLSRKYISQNVRDDWKEKLNNIREDSYWKLWEDTFIIESLLLRDNYTNAYIIFSQILESYLSLRCQNLSLCQPNLETLVNEWTKLTNADKNWVDLLHELRKKRNDIIHKQESITFESFKSLWRRNGFPVDKINKNQNLINLIIPTLQKVCGSKNTPPPDTLLSSLSQWGLTFLQS